MDKIASLHKYKSRIIDNTIKKYLETFGAICIEGPKWCGKTWTSSFHANSEFYIANPDNNFQNRALAMISPSLVLEGAAPRLLDEWQEVPLLWDAVRFEVDKRAKKGQFILTGSSTPVRKGIMHSGAGRIARLKMRTMSLYESGDSSGLISLEALCNNNLISSITGEISLRALAELIVRGGWPANIDVPANNISLLPESYINTILDDDTQRIDGKKYDRKKMRLLLLSLARHESSTATNKKLQNDIEEFDDKKVDADTLSTYLDVFNRMFLLDNQPPFSVNVRSSTRVKQAEKRHFCDPSLPCAMLKMTPEKLIADLKTFGFMFESLCERDLKIYAESFGGTLFHYQDYSGNEIDAVVEMPDGNWCAFEIKLGANKIDEAAKNLINVCNRIIMSGDRAPSIMCVICGMTNAAYQRPDGVFVVPITALKN